MIDIKRPGTRKAIRAACEILAAKETQEERDEFLEVAIALGSEVAAALASPEHLARMFEQELSARGLEFSTDPDNCWIDSLHEAHGNPFDGVLIHPRALTMTRAYVVLDRVLALPADATREQVLSILETD